MASKKETTEIEEVEQEFHEVGCMNCNSGGNWKIFTDGEGHFKAKCRCGHISDFVVTTHRNVEGDTIKVVIMTKPGKPAGKEVGR